MKYIVDRIEGKKVICENQENMKMEEFTIDKFQADIKEGDVVTLTDNKFEKDKQQTIERKKKIDEMMKKLMKG